jgi:tetratricopeptide (TPR) repeat protein
VAKLEHHSLSMAGLRQTKNFLRELRMTGKVRRKKSEAGSLVFWLNLITVCSFALLLLCTTLLVGCKSRQVAGTGGVQTIPPAQRKAELLKTLDRKFENPQAHYELGQVYLAEKQWLKAEYHFSQAISFDPAHSEAQAAMVKVFIESGDTAKSKTYADIYMNQAAGSASASFRLGLAFQKQLLDEYAFDCYMQAIHLDPTFAKVHKQLGYYYLGKNDKVRAEEYFKRSFNLDPVQPDVAGELGRLGVEVRIPGKAERNTRKVNKAGEKREVYKWGPRAGP